MTLTYYNTATEEQIIVDELLQKYYYGFSLLLGPTNKN